MSRNWTIRSYRAHLNFHGACEIHGIPDSGAFALCKPKQRDLGIQILAAKGLKPQPGSQRLKEQRASASTLGNLIPGRPKLDFTASELQK